MDKGKVFLVGAGPGDPGLITVRGLECIAQADVIIYDRLVDQRLLAQAKPGAELIYAGKSPQGHTLTQEEINALLVAKAKEKKVIARLKGGDPFVFGRGGEEAETLVSEGIPFEVVPGVTSAVAVPAYAGIPVTHRRFASSLAILTGHEEEGKGETRIPWDKIATGVDTLIFLMGMANLPYIVTELLKHGRPDTTPIALIRWGTRPQQETLEGILGDIVDRAREANFGPPAVAVVGEVVGLRQKLRWFDVGPLFGKRVLVTRSRRQASTLSALLVRHGAQPIELPTIEVEAVDYTALDIAIAHLADYAWVIFTSVNGVEAFFQRLRTLGHDARALKGITLVAIGPATAQALEGFGVRADLIPQDYSAEGILSAISRKKDIKGVKMLLPRAEQVPPKLKDGLIALGAQVEEVAVYRTVPATSSPSAKALFHEGQVDIVTFTSSSTVKNLVAMLDGETVLINRATIACIGPVTAETARKLGLRVDVVAKEHTIAGLVEALKEYLVKARRRS